MWRRNESKISCITVSIKITITYVIIWSPHVEKGETTKIDKFNLKRLRTELK